MGKLISIDNGGTLTDVCVVDGTSLYYTKTLTTPHDLTRCLVDGLKKVSRVIYGEDRLLELLRTTDCLRYSTTQGTNALVQRQGPRLALVLREGAAARFLERSSATADLLAVLVGDRFGAIDLTLRDDAYEAAVVGVVNGLTSAGAHRLVVSFAGPDGASEEARFKRVWLRRFPRHFLGVVPVVFSREVAEDPDDERRTTTALLNAFLHPAMEGFLYHAEHVLRDAKARRPLLIFRNDGDSARVAKTVAIKTYGSGPRGGMEGARALAAQHGFDRLLTLDVGGTTTDIGLVEGDRIRGKRRGEIEGVAISFPLADVVSIGVGGSSVIRAERGGIAVGPESVGAAPGPACFALGGTAATITDAFLAKGLFDPVGFFDGELALDRERAEAAVRRNVAEPLGIGLEPALVAMERAWVERIAAGASRYVPIPGSTALVSFGGAGPAEACSIAARLGLCRVVIPALAAVFSAFGIAFSDLAQSYEVRLAAPTAAALGTALAELRERARRDMFAEGLDLADCRQELGLLRACDGEETVVPFDGGPTLPADLRPGEELSLSLRVVKAIPHPGLARDDGVEPTQAVASGVRRVLHGEAGWRELPVFRVDVQRRGARGRGPAVLEGPFFTGRVAAGWQFAIDASGDILCTREREGEAA